MSRDEAYPDTKWKQRYGSLRSLEETCGAHKGYLPMRTYTITISDFRMYRTPQEQIEFHDVSAADADDAVRIAQHNFNFPLAELLGPDGWHYRTFKEILAK